MANIDKAFEVEGGIIIDDGAAILSGSLNPVGTPAPFGSLYLRTDNTLWEKFGQSDNDWQLKALTSQKNFSYKKIPNNQSITIRTNQQMIVSGEIEIESGGELIIEANGELVLWP